MDKKIKLQFKITEEARKNTLLYSQKNEFELDNIEYVVPFVKTNFIIHVVFFFKEEKNNTLENRKAIQDFWDKTVTEMSYYETFPKGITFEFDTLKNVKDNFKGSYFYRMR